MKHESVAPKLYTYCRGQLSSYEFFMRELNRRKHELGNNATAAAPSIQGIINQLLELKISAEASAQRTPTEVLALLRLCLDLGCNARCQDIFALLLQKYPPTAANVTAVLLPTLKGLPEILTKHQIPPDTQPFKGYIKDIFIAWIRDVLGPKPAEITYQVNPVHENILRCASSGIGCRDCSELVSFLSSSETKISIERIGAPKVKHLASQLASCYGSTRLTWSTIMEWKHGIEVRPSG